MSSGPPSNTHTLLIAYIYNNGRKRLFNHHKYYVVNTGVEQLPVWMCQQVVMETAAFLLKTWLLTFNSPAALLKSSWF